MRGCELSGVWINDGVVVILVCLRVGVSDSIIKDKMPRYRRVSRRILNRQAEVRLRLERKEEMPLEIQPKLTLESPDDTTDVITGDESIDEQDTQKSLEYTIEDKWEKYKNAVENSERICVTEDTQPKTTVEDTQPKVTNVRFIALLTVGIILWVTVLYHLFINVLYGSELCSIYISYTTQWGYGD